MLSKNKNIFFIILIMITMLSMMACSNDEEQPNPTSTQTSLDSTTDTLAQTKIKDTSYFIGNWQLIETSSEVFIHANISNLNIDTSFYLDDSSAKELLPILNQTEGYINIDSSFYYKIILFDDNTLLIVEEDSLKITENGINLLSSFENEENLSIKVVNIDSSNMEIGITGIFEKNMFDDSLTMTITINAILTYQKINASINISEKSDEEYELIDDDILNDIGRNLLKIFEISATSKKDSSVLDTTEIYQDSSEVFVCIGASYNCNTLESSWLTQTFTIKYTAYYLQYIIFKEMLHDNTYREFKISYDQDGNLLVPKVKYEGETEWRSTTMDSIPVLVNSAQFSYTNSSNYNIININIYPIELFEDSIYNQEKFSTYEYSKQTNIDIWQDYTKRTIYIKDTIDSIYINIDYAASNPEDADSIKTIILENIK